MIVCKPLIAAAAALGFLIAPQVSASAASTPAAADCTSAGDADFNGDGFDDAVIADPAATVNDQNRAGQVHVLYGGSGGQVGEGGAREVLRQGMPGVGGTVGAADNFGLTLLVGRVNEDACADLVVGVPHEDLPSAPDAGIVHVTFGSPSGLGHEADPIVLSQGTSSIPGSVESYDRFGSSLALGPDGATLAIGVPAEDIGSLQDAGLVNLVWVSGNAPSHGISISQNTVGVPGSAEPGDYFGSSVAIGKVRGQAGLPDLIAGAPREAIGSLNEAGAVTVINDVVPDKTSFTAVAITQDSSGVPGAAEAGDSFGSSLAYGTSGSTARLAVGAEREDVGSIIDAGVVQLFSSTGTSLNPGAAISQNTAGIIGSAEKADRFGFALAMASQSVTGGGLQLIVGIPYEDVGNLGDAGAVQVLTVTNPAADAAYDQNSTGVAGTPEPNDHFGWSVTAAGGTSEGAMLIGVPHDGQNTTGLVNVIPVGGAGRFWKPGVGGIATTGAVLFGYTCAG
ncbi:MAG: integrin alpha [Micromonosporaceae bacterium]